MKSRPLAGMNYPGKGGRGGSFAPRNDRFSLGSFVRDMAIGAVMGGLASVAFYGAGKGVEALRQGIQKRHLSEQSKQIVYEKKHLFEYNLQFFAEKEPEESLWKPTLKKWDLWKKGKLNIHYKNHGISEFGAKSKEEYSEMAYEFRVRRPNDIIQGIYDDTYVYRYEPLTDNIFVGTLSGGRIKTFYKWDGRDTDNVIKFFKEISKIK